MTLMADFEAEMAGLDDSTATADKAEWILRTAADIRRSLQNAETRGVAILDRLAALGDGASAEEAMTKDGMSSRAAREAADRARAHKKAAEAVNADQGADEDDGTEDATREVPLALPEINPENLEAMRRAEKSLGLPEEQELFNQHRATITYQAQTLDPTTFKIRLKALINTIRAQVASTTEDRHRKSSDLKSWVGKNGMRAVFGEWDRERGDAIWVGLEREMRALANAARESDGEALALDGNLAAEALFQILMRAFNPDAKTSRPLVGVFVDEDTLRNGRHNDTVAERFGEPGSNISSETLRRYLCDCDLEALTLNGTKPLDVGRTYRTASNAQRLALRAIYDCCAFPGCDTTFDWCQIHHIDYWENGGRTDLNNLAPLCSRHHHFAHEGGWTLKLLPDRTLRVWKPDGQPYSEAAPQGPATRWRDSHGWGGQSCGGQGCGGQSCVDPGVSDDHHRSAYEREREPAHN